jgi:nucleoside-diphosphate kinase
VIALAEGYGPREAIGSPARRPCGPVTTLKSHAGCAGLPTRRVIVVTERTLVLIKPDAVRRRLVGELISRLERKDLVIEAMALRVMDSDLADTHYAEHVAKPFYPTLKGFMTSGPLVSMIVSGDSAIDVVRGLVGATDGRKAAAGTMRGDYSLSNTENLIHASDSPDSAKREIALWFPDVDLA